MHRIEQIAETYAWYPSVGNRVEETPLARYVCDPQRPDVWDANHLSRVRARDPQEIARVLERADRALAHCSHRMVIVDPLTPDALVARLALDGYRELTPTLQMVLDESSPVAESADPRPIRGPAALELAPVRTEDDWDALYRLTRANHLEGSSSHHLQLDEDVTRGLVAGYRARTAVAQFFLARLGGAPCAYGSAVLGPYGMGIVEDLFTLPEHRRHGIARAIIARAVDHARERGMGPMLIGAHVTEVPKAYYARLGFVPACVTRQYLLEAGER
jgi:GNAT superfamily N-acetyltransferase